MSNPILSEQMLQKSGMLAGAPMTINGAINKTFILFACLLATSFYTWTLAQQGYTDKVHLLMFGGMIAGFITAMIIIFARKWMNVLAPVYALAQGCLLGGITIQFESVYHGIAIQAVGATFAAFGAMLFLYKAGLIRCTDKFRSTLMIAMFGVLGIYLINFIGGFFGMQIPHIFGSGLIGIGFSALVCTIAALNFIIDFDIIERGAASGADKSLEWYGAFGLMVTFIWLYIEILRLLAKLRDNR